MTDASAPPHGTTPGSFDERAATWDDQPGTVTRARAVADAIRAAVPLAATTRVLEYGAGTGLLSEALAPDVGPLTVTDPSHGMREVIAAKIAAGVLPDATVADLDLERDPPPPADHDLVVTMMALHHVADVPRVLAGFAASLVPGGVVAIIDLDAEDGSFHGGPDHHPGHDADPDHLDDAADGHVGGAGEAATPGHAHDGFDRDELAGWLTAAGFGPTAFTRAHGIEKHGRTYDLFLATASLAADDGAPQPPA